jgi:hypothetical protein
LAVRENRLFTLTNIVLVLIAMVLVSAFPVGVFAMAGAVIAFISGSVLMGFCRLLSNSTLLKSKTNKKGSSAAVSNDALHAPDTVSHVVCLAQLPIPQGQAEATRFISFKRSSVNF